MRKSSRKSAKVSSGERRYTDCRKGLVIEAICWRLVRKERKKRKSHPLIDEVWNWRNLNEAWEKVKSNKGAGGIDEVTIEEFERSYTLFKRRGCASEKPDEGKPQVRFCEGAHSNLRANTPIGGVL